MLIGKYTLIWGDYMSFLSQVQKLLLKRHN